MLLQKKITEQKKCVKIADLTVIYVKICVYLLNNVNTLNFKRKKVGNWQKW